MCGSRRKDRCAFAQTHLACELSFLPTDHVFFVRGGCLWGRHNSLWSAVCRHSLHGQMQSPINDCGGAQVGCATALCSTCAQRARVHIGAPRLCPIVLWQRARD
eukprot:11202770-Lingulodinium_polyedra.AAC.1